MLKCAGVCTCSVNPCNTPAPQSRVCLPTALVMQLLVKSYWPLKLYTDKFLECNHGYLKAWWKYQTLN